MTSPLNDKISHPPIPWGISTLGCPELSLEEAARLADRFGIFFLELRALENSLALESILTRPENSSLMAELCAAGRIRMIDSTFWCCDPTEESFDELCALAAMADRYHVPFVRIFGTRSQTRPTESQLVEGERSIKHFLWQNFACRLVLETHDGFSAAADCAAFAARFQLPPATLWDVHHTLHAGESLETSFQFLKASIVSFHVKDWDEEGNAVLPGCGILPWRELRPYFEQLPGVPVIYESERLWEADFPPLEEVLPQLAEQWN